MFTIKELLEVAKERGFLYRHEVLETIPEAIDEKEQIDDIVQFFIDLGIKVVDDSKE